MNTRPDPVGIRFVTPPAVCEFLPGRIRRMEYDVVPHLTPDQYLQRMQQGWRRFGHAMFRPACGPCRMCRSLRIPVAHFRADRSQARAWKANVDDVRIIVGEPHLTAEKQAIFDRFHAHQHEAKILATLLRGLRSAARWTIAEQRATPHRVAS